MCSIAAEEEDEPSAGSGVDICVHWFRDWGSGDLECDGEGEIERESGGHRLRSPAVEAAFLTGRGGESENPDDIMQEFCL